MIVSIMQPAFLPWLGYFNRLALSDVHIVLDHVQLDKSSKTNFANRNKIRTREGWCWLTVPILRKGRSGQLALNDIEISPGTDWGERAWASISHNYGKAPFFASYRDRFEAIFQTKHERLIDVAVATTEALRDAFGIEVPTRYSSELRPAHAKDTLILELVQQVGGTRYVSGPFGRDYLDAQRFQQAGIELMFHDYVHPHYNQVFDGFEPYMSALDLLFNCGPDARTILTASSDLKRS